MFIDWFPYKYLLEFYFVITIGEQVQSNKLQDIPLTLICYYFYSLQITIRPLLT